jgi:hypothetical protein
MGYRLYNVFLDLDSIHIFHMIRRINNDYFRKGYLANINCNGDAVYSVRWKIKI